MLPGRPCWHPSPSLPTRFFPGSHSTCRWGTFGGPSPGSQLGIAPGHHILTAQHQTHVRIFQYQLLFILDLYNPQRHAHVVPCLSWLLGAQEPSLAMYHEDFFLLSSADIFLLQLLVPTRIPRLLKYSLPFLCPL